MAESERKVVIAIDASEQAEHAFHCEYCLIDLPPKPTRADQTQTTVLVASMRKMQLDGLCCCVVYHCC